MDAFNRVVSTVSEAFVFNQATLSGSVDIIIVKQKDGSYKGTGFHARFGKVHAIKSKDRIVRIEINNVPTNVTMKLGDGGEAYFEDEVIDFGENELSDDSLQHENPPSLENILYNSGSNSEAKSQSNRIELLNNVEPNQAKVERLVSSKITDNIDKQNVLCQSDNKAEKENELYTEIDKENRSASSVAKKINTGITATVKVQSDSDPETSILSSPQKANNPKSPQVPSQTKTSRVRRGLRLSSEKIKLLNLRPGQNTITYIINTGLQGTQKLHANVYLWSYNTKLIVTDVDGTITKSDFLGAILPLLGKDWTQPGIAPLFANIHRNGYQILYLTSRAIGQIGFTRDFVKSVHQDGKNLPQGPIISSPDQLLSCFKREIVFSKPEFFKSAALRDIRNLFPADQNPFHAGFGNRENDAVAYRFVGIPLENIFTVNGNGEVHHAAHTLYKSYAYLNAKVKEIFPCIHIHCATCGSGYKVYPINFCSKKIS